MLATYPSILVIWVSSTGRKARSNLLLVWCKAKDHRELQILSDDVSAPCEASFPLLRS